MFHLAIRVDCPGCDRVVVLAWKRSDGWNLSGLASLGYKLRACGLHISSVVPCAALQYCGTAVPPPRDTESRESFAVDRFLERCLCPGLATIGGNRDF